MQKEDIRQQIFDMRRKIDPLKWQKDTEAITSLVTTHPWFREAVDIYCYVDFGGEVGTRPLMQEAWRLGKNIWVPKVRGDSMEFYHISCLEDLSYGCFGIMEPGETKAAAGEDGLMIMPGVAFDRQCNRIGFGGGYYDRYLSFHPTLDTMALAFDFQVFDAVETDSHDIRPARVVTPSGILESS